MSSVCECGGVLDCKKSKILHFHPFKPAVCAIPPPVRDQKKREPMDDRVEAALNIERLAPRGKAIKHKRMADSPFWRRSRAAGGAGEGG